MAHHPAGCLLLAAARTAKSIDTELRLWIPLLNEGCAADIARRCPACGHRFGV
ncbi:hypothetical protein QZH56_17840 [Streptomyces olivoreticuli]|uniref:hypothetical protein n=1 Tax=Streptomyces olivoreticuli TaxID=68246 RepID=UPI002657C0D5|nr:hypothetical protein [Streptomyces olivoreticuli]WKK27286.1 hypothetical protein QZH56_17840 [Streptomyces olivoreticuli]